MGLLSNIKKGLNQINFRKTKDAESLESMSARELKALAKQMGVPYQGLRSHQIVGLLKSKMVKDASGASKEETAGSNGTTMGLGNSTGIAAGTTTKETGSATQISAPSSSLSSSSSRGLSFSLGRHRRAKSSAAIDFEAITEEWVESAIGGKSSVAATEGRVVKVNNALHILASNKEETDVVVSAAAVIDTAPTAVDSSISSGSSGARGVDDGATELENLSLGAMPVDVAENVFALLDAKDLATCRCVSRDWRDIASSCSLWRPLCESLWRIEEPRAPDRTPCQTYMEAFNAHAELYWSYGSLYPLARDTVDGFRAWATEKFPEVAQTLAPGATEEDLRELEEDLGVSLPPAFRVFYLLCNGQNLLWDQRAEENREPEPDDSMFHGLIGGYTFYQHFVNVRLLSLQSIAARMRILPDHSSRGRNSILVAASFNWRKLFYLNCDDGLVYVRLMGGRRMPCVPQETQEPKQRDGFLRWLSEYLTRLRAGVYTVRTLHDLPFTRGICLFPETEPECTTAVTYGVEVRASSIFVPENSTMDDSMPNSRYFAYSVRMRLLDWDSARDNGPMTQNIRSCQLHTRHWIVHDGDTIVRDFRGDAVIGEYPNLERGGRPYVYQSTSSGNNDTGSLEGDFSFLPGSLDRPLGAEFEAQVARLQFTVPSFIY